jgi:methylated-DNA-[protein]-cysteine S-methyltransferase
MMNNFYYIFETKSGWTGIAGSSAGIFRTTLPEDSRENALQALDLNDMFQKCHADYFPDLVRTFKNYYLGLQVEFKVKLDLSGLTNFQKSVYQATMAVPYGETCSYGRLAVKIGNPRAARAVGQALSRNPLPVIVPCHRILTTGKGLCGFRGGLTMKRYLLDLEANKGNTHPQL